MIAQNLKAYIDENGYKQRTIAVKAGIGEQTLSDILNGRRQLKADVFASICAALGVSLDAIAKCKEENVCE